MNAAGSVSYTLTCENSSGSTPRTVTITAAPAVISGKLVAPDGETPVAGATIYAATTPMLSALHANRKADPTDSTCAPPNASSLASTCTAADGSFWFTVDATSDDTFSLVAEKGMFRMAQAVPVAIATAVGNLALPKDVDQGAPRIAVITGNYSEAEVVMAKLGLATLNLADEKIDMSTAAFAMFDDRAQLDPTPPKYSLPDVAALFEVNPVTSLPKLREFDVIVVNSGAQPGVLQNSSNLAALRAYVENGGVLFVLDRSIDFIEQPMPEYLRTLGENDTAPQTPSELWSGLEGLADVSLEVSTDDALLGPWLQGVSCIGGDCLNSNETIRMDRFDSVWTVLEGAHSAHAADVLVTTRAVVPLPADTREHPLSVMFRPGQGQVIFTSFSTVSDESMSAGLYPQERVLQYLMLGAGE
jgi:hypothetical protein